MYRFLRYKSILTMLLHGNVAYKTTGFFFFFCFSWDNFVLNNYEVYYVYGTHQPCNQLSTMKCLYKDCCNEDTTLHIQSLERINRI